MMITTTPTLQSRMQTMTSLSLPQTYRDAVQLTRYLGIRYLWIDSLCILQDSVVDWAEQSALMGDVYRHSVLNISATLGKDCRHGLLHKRTQHHGIPIPCQSHTLGSSGRLFLRPVPKTWHKSLEGEDSPLSSRGWVLQERILSPRTVHYGKEQMFWECVNCRLSKGNVQLNREEFFSRVRRKGRRGSLGPQQKVPSTCW